MKRIIKLPVGYFILLDYLDNISLSCQSVLSSDEKLNSAFNALSERCSELVEASYFGNVVEQYVVVVCEGEEEI